MVRKGLNVVYLKDGDVELIDKYIQAHFSELRKKKKASRSAIVRDVVRSWAKDEGLQSQ